MDVRYGCRGGPISGVRLVWPCRRKPRHPGLHPAYSGLRGPRRTRGRLGKHGGPPRSRRTNAIERVFPLSGSIADMAGLATGSTRSRMTQMYGPTPETPIGSLILVNFVIRRLWCARQQSSVKGRPACNDVSSSALLGGVAAAWPLAAVAQTIRCEQGLRLQGESGCRARSRSGSAQRRPAGEDPLHTRPDREKRPTCYSSSH